MSGELYLARRYLLSHRSGAWGWLIGWMATGSVAIGVAALIITLAVMTGFRQDIQQKILGVQPHVLLTSFDGQINPSDEILAQKIANSKEIEAWSPYVMGQVLIGRGGSSAGAMVKGIDSKREPAVAGLNGKLVQGEWNSLDSVRTAQEKPAILLGQELARNLGARVGDTVWLITPGSLGLTALSIPKAHLFKVTGLVQTGLYDYDSGLAFMSIEAAQRLFNVSKGVSGVGIRLKDVDKADVFARRLQDEFEGKYWVRSWLSLNRNLFSALKLEKTVMFIILILVTVVASFMIVSNLLLSISQKVKEIGILRAMGATSLTIRKLFLIQGLLMGIVGTAIGTVLGAAISLTLARTRLIRLPADVYYIDRLPVQIDVLDIATVVFAATVIVLIATLYPAHRAAELDPLEAIRYG